MYTAHFGLNGIPFALTPNSQLLYFSERHRAALDHLNYGIHESSGVAVLTSEAGMGKTTLCHAVIQQLPANIDAALIQTPPKNALAFFAALFKKLHLNFSPKDSLYTFIETFQSYLNTAHAVGRRTVLIVDDAHTLSLEVLAELGPLAAVDNAKLKILLIGRSELTPLLKRDTARPLAQRITARYHLLPLSLKETNAYITHRLTVSGARESLFTPAAIKLIYGYTKGVPRAVNLLCHHALTTAYLYKKNPVDIPLIYKAAQESRLEKRGFSKRHWLIASLSVLGLGVIGLWYGNYLSAPLSSEEITPPVKAAPPPISSKVTPPTALKTETAATTSKLAQLLKDGQNDLQSAFVTLFRYWQQDYQRSSGASPCERAASQGLACLYKTGTWEDIRRLNHPVILEVSLDKLKQSHIVVTQLQEQRASLEIAGKTQELSTSEISEYWQGQFLILWKPPELPVKTLKVGMTGAPILWLRQQLDAIEGKKYNPATAAPRFDNALKNRLIHFQQQQGLTADGTAGDSTLLALSAHSPLAPLLTPPK